MTPPGGLEIVIVLVMLAIVVAIIVGIVLLVVRLVRRSKQPPQYWQPPEEGSPRT
jgi:heme/copper-type cytochrome/quinol oxidase subunit 2